MHYKVKLSLLPIAVLLLFSISSFGQDESFIVLGDIHFDKFEYHDLDYLRTRPQDYRQVFQEYPQYSAFFLPDLLKVIKKKSISNNPPIKAVTQLGDLVQGVSGNGHLSRQMNRGVVDLLHSVDLDVPWVLAKGNHDVSNSPGQPEAWSEVIRPFIEGQVKKSINDGMYTYKISDNTEFFVIDQFFSKDKNLPESEMVTFLEKELLKSTAKYKFLLTHQPVIPVTERSWHLLSGARRPVDNKDLRENLLNLLGRHKVIVLTAHLHEYSVLSRKTPYGNIVQIMINSVNRGLKPPQPKNSTSVYKGGQWAIENKDWEPSTRDERVKMLDEEKKNILSFLRADLPGYGIINIMDSENTVFLHFYKGLSEVPFEIINLTELQNH